MDGQRAAEAAGKPGVYGDADSGENPKAVLQKQVRPPGAGGAAADYAPCPRGHCLPGPVSSGTKPNRRQKNQRPPAGEPAPGPCLLRRLRTEYDPGGQGTAVLRRLQKRRNPVLYQSFYPGEHPAQCSVEGAGADAASVAGGEAGAGDASAIRLRGGSGEQGKTPSGPDPGHGAALSGLGPGRSAGGAVFGPAGGLWPGVDGPGACFGAGGGAASHAPEPKPSGAPGSGGAGGGRPGPLGNRSPGKKAMVAAGSGAAPMPCPRGP